MVPGYFSLAPVLLLLRAKSTTPFRPPVTLLIKLTCARETSFSPGRSSASPSEPTWTLISGRGTRIALRLNAGGSGAEQAHIYTIVVDGRRYGASVSFRDGTFRVPDGSHNRGESLQTASVRVPLDVRMVKAWVRARRGRSAAASACEGSWRRLEVLLHGPELRGGSRAVVSNHPGRLPIPGQHRLGGRCSKPCQLGC